MHTPFPWAQSDSQPRLVFAKNLGLDFKRPVAKFNHAEDARCLINILVQRDELLAALRGNLKLLEEELKNRRSSGMPEYIGPVETAVDRTKKAIAIAEGWI